MPAIVAPASCDNDSYRSGARQPETITSAIEPSPTLPGVAEKESLSEQVVAAAKALGRTFRDARAAYEEKHGKVPNKELARIVGFSDAQISQLMGVVVKDYQLSTVLKVQAFSGLSLHEVLGQPAPPVEASARQVAEAAVEAFVARMREDSEAPARTGTFRKRKKSRADRA